MKRKILVLTLVLVMMMLLTACKKKAPGQLTGDAMLAMVPEGPVMLMAFNFQQFAALDLFDKMIKDDWEKNAKAGKAFKDYQDFVAQTGVDLQKDVYSVVGAIYGGFDSENPEGIGIVNMKYDADKLLAVLKQKEVFTAAEKYRDRNVYTLKKDDGGKDAHLAFLNKTCLLFGSPLQVRKAIDLDLDKGKSVLQTPSLMKYVEPLDKKKMFWLAVGNIPEKMKSAPAGGMMPVDLSKAEAFTACVDFKGGNLSGELKLISFNEQGNKQIVEMLNGLKALGAMGSAKEPELGQLLNGIQLSATADAITLTFSIAEELMNKLGAKAKDKASSMASAAAPVQPEAMPVE